jgi:hypothetical protein
MTDVSDYAIVDITEGRRTVGKVLVLLDDEQTAQEIAIDLTKRGCRVVVEAFGPPDEHLNQSPRSQAHVRAFRVRNNQPLIARAHPVTAGLDGSSSMAVASTDQMVEMPVRRRRRTSK